MKKQLFDHAEFWDFSVRTYAVKGVMESCLWLQDKEHADVNLLLLMAWLDDTETALTNQHIQNLIRISEEWQKNRLQPLRTARKTISKNAPEYRQALATELETEKQEQCAFVDYLNDSFPDARAASPPRGTDNLKAYALQAGLSMPRVIQLRVSVHASAQARSL